MEDVEEEIGMKPVIDTSTTDRDGLDVATGGVDETSFNSVDLPDTPDEEHAKKLREKKEQERRSEKTKEEIIAMGTDHYKKVEELKALFKENGYALDAGYKKFNFYQRPGSSSVELWFSTKRGKIIEFIDQRNKKKFRSFNAILKDLSSAARGQLGVYKIVELKIDDDIKDLSSVKKVNEELIQMQSVDNERLSDTRESISEATDETEKQELTKKVEFLENKIKDNEQMQRELKGYRKELDTIDGQLKLAIAERELAFNQLAHEKAKLKDVEENGEASTVMGADEIKKKNNRP